jgi:hypothetical protein
VAVGELLRDELVMAPGLLERRHDVPDLRARTSSMRMATIESMGVITSDTTSSLRLMPRAWLMRTGRSPRMSVVVTRPRDGRRLP